MLDTVSRIDLRWHDTNQKSVKTLAHHLAQQPLTHLQNDSRIEGASSSRRLLAVQEVAASELDAHQWTITMREGVAAKLTRLGFHS